MVAQIICKATPQCPFHSLATHIRHHNNNNHHHRRQCCSLKGGGEILRGWFIGGMPIKKFNKRMVYCVAEKYFPRQLTLASCHTSPHDHYVERACDSCVVVLQKLIRTWWLSCSMYSLEHMAHFAMCVYILIKK